MGALDNIKVLDYTHFLAGPWCSMILADLGADVIKVETPDGESRKSSGNVSSFNFKNRNKRSIGVDLKSEAGRDLIRRLIESTDVFIENHRPGVMRAMGLGYEDLSAINPRLIYCSISGFGQDGPYSARGCYDLISQAMSGLMSLNGEVGADPVAMGVPISDLSAGTFGAIAILAAINHRHISGQGQYVEATLLETALACAVPEVSLYLATGEVARPRGSAHRNATPYEVFRTQDGLIVIGAATQRLFERACKVLGAEHLLQDPAFATMRSRLANRQAFCRELETILARDTSDNWLAKFAASGIPCGPINTIDKALADPQVKARGLICEADGHPYLRTPVTLHRTPVSLRSGVPQLGGSNGDVLRECGFSAREIEALSRSGAIFERQEETA